jgi:DNA repair exonuclease SbcCD ATPase subunit
MKTLYAALATIAVLAAIGTGIWFHGDRHGATRIQTQYDTFKHDTEALGLQGKLDAANKELKDAREAREQEAANVKNLSDVNDRYARRIAELRAHPAATGAGQGGVPTADSPPTVCADAADNDRLSDAFRHLYRDLLQRYQEAEQQTSTLTGCQKFVVTNCSPQPTGSANP